MKLLDISWPISSATTGYKDRYKVQFSSVKNFDTDAARESTIQVSSHTGTHIDAPAHFLRDGKTIDQLELERFSGSCIILDLTNVIDHITDEHLQKYDDLITNDNIVLLKTSNSFINATDPFNPHFIYLHQSGARYLAAKEIKTVGIDYLGIERGDPTHPTHTLLMQAEITIIEGLRLADIEQGEYPFMCLPLNIIGLEAAPARAVLLVE